MDELERIRRWRLILGPDSEERFAAMRNKGQEEEGGAGGMGGLELLGLSKEQMQIGRAHV